MRNCSHLVSIALVLTMSATTVFGAGKRKEKIQVVTHSEKIQAGIQYEFSRSLGPGRLVRAHDGVDGSITRTYRITYVDEKQTKRELLKEERKEAQPTIFYMGHGGVKLDRGSFGRKKVLDMVATAYDPGPASNGWSNRGRTRMGRKATYGEVAVDPRVIPLGSVVFVEGYGLAIASDTGSAIKGKRIDLCYDSKRFADNFGYKKVRVHILSLR